VKALVGLRSSIRDALAIIAVVVIWPLALILVGLVHAVEVLRHGERVGPSPADMVRSRAALAHEIPLLSSDAPTRVLPTDAGHRWLTPEWWWDRRRGRRHWSSEARDQISRQLESVAPDLYIYWDTPYDAPSAHFDPRWEAVACALEDAYYAEAYRSRLTATQWMALREPWERITQQVRYTEVAAARE
jgi:hypothetical protein